MASDNIKKREITEIEKRGEQNKKIRQGSDWLLVPAGTCWYLRTDFLLAETDRQ